MSSIYSVIVHILFQINSFNLPGVSQRCRRRLFFRSRKHGNWVRGDKKNISPSLGMLRMSQRLDRERLMGIPTTKECNSYSSFEFWEELKAVCSYTFFWQGQKRIPTEMMIKLRGFMEVPIMDDGSISIILLPFALALGELNIWSGLKNGSMQVLVHFPWRKRKGYLEDFALEEIWWKTKREDEKRKELERKTEIWGKSCRWDR